MWPCILQKVQLPLPLLTPCLVFPSDLEATDVRLFGVKSSFSAAQSLHELVSVVNLTFEDPADSADSFMQTLQTLLCRSERCPLM